MLIFCPAAHSVIAIECLELLGGTAWDGALWLFYLQTTQIDALGRPWGRYFYWFILFKCNFAFFSCRNSKIRNKIKMNEIKSLTAFLFGFLRCLQFLLQSTFRAKSLRNIITTWVSLTFLALEYNLDFLYLHLSLWSWRLSIFIS